MKTGRLIQEKYWIIEKWYFETLPVNSGQLIKGEGDKTVPIDENEWNIDIFLYLLV